MGETPGSPTVSMKLQSIAPQAQRDPAMVFTNVVHLSDRAFLLAAYRLTRQTSAPGIDQVTAPPYAEPLDDNLRDLQERRHDQRDVAPPVERVWSEKEGGKKRPIGTPGFEAKRVQRAGVMILEALFEPDVHPFAHGCRKGHRPHQALRELREQCRTLPSNWRVEADVSGCFDHVAGGFLRELIQQRVQDGRILRRIGQWLPAGVWAAGALPHPAKGPPQGGVASPLVAHVCLHQVLDDGLVKDVQPRLQGRCLVTRFADEFIIGGALEADARRGMAVLPKRCHRFKLTMHPEQTALMAVKRPPSRAPSAGGRGSFDFLGFTHDWAQTRRGYWVIQRKTVGKRRRRLMQAIWTGCRDNRQAPLQEQ